MKRILFLLLVIITSFSFGQNANLDKAYFRVSYTNLPSHPVVDIKKRTYTTNNNRIYISGFTKANPATITIDFLFNGTNIYLVKIKRRESIKKDENGRPKRIHYIAVSKYTSTANLIVKDLITGEEYKKSYSLKKRNRSPKFSSYSQALDYYNNNKYKLRDNYSSKQKMSMLRKSNAYLNSNFGYPIRNKKTYFWILGQNKHPEYAKHNANYEKAKAIFAKMKADEPIDNIKKELQPIIDYFITTAKKYVGKKKRMRKMRYASYYNLAIIYYYLDNPAKTKEYAEKLIANDYDKKDGESLIEMANNLQMLFDTNKTVSRHFKVQRETAQKLNRNNAVSHHIKAQRQENSNSTQNKDEVLAYLITKTNDTIQTVIPKNNIAKIGYSVYLETTESSGKKAIKRYMAEDCKTLALTNENMYQVINFKEAKKGKNSPTLKFVKVLFESDKIGLYVFNQQELVLKLPNEAKGISTKSSKFIFGVNKELGKYAANCPKALAATKAKEFKNTAESLTKFCKMLTTCK